MEVNERSTADLGGTDGVRVGSLHGINGGGEVCLLKNYSCLAQSFFLLQIHGSRTERQLHSQTLHWTMDILRYQVLTLTVKDACGQLTLPWRPKHRDHPPQNPESRDKPSTDACPGVHSANDELTAVLWAIYLMETSLQHGSWSRIPSKIAARMDSLGTCNDKPINHSSSGTSKYCSIIDCIPGMGSIFSSPSMLWTL